VGRLADRRGAGLPARPRRAGDPREHGGACALSRRRHRRGHRRRGPRRRSENGRARREPLVHPPLRRGPPEGTLRKRAGRAFACGRGCARATTRC
jgi:hypothetical protein